MTKNQIHDLYFQYFDVKLIGENILPTDALITMMKSLKDCEKDGSERKEIKKKKCRRKRKK